MAIGDILSLAALAGVVLAIWLGRRKGRNRFAAAISAARAEGHAEAKVELAATLANVVNVQVGHDSRQRAGELTGDDIYQRVLDAHHVRTARDLGPGHDDFHYLNDYDGRALGTSRRPAASEQFVDVGPAGRGHRSADGDGVDRGETEVSPWARPA